MDKPTQEEAARLLKPKYDLMDDVDCIWESNKSEEEIVQFYFERSLQFVHNKDKDSFNICFEIISDKTDCINIRPLADTIYNSLINCNLMKIEGEDND